MQILSVRQSAEAMVHAGPQQCIIPGLLKYLANQKGIIAMLMDLATGNVVLVRHKIFTMRLKGCSIVSRTVIVVD